MQLNAMPLFHQQAFVAGQWCDADSLKALIFITQQHKK